MPKPHKERMDEVSEEIEELEGAIWELAHVPNSEAARRSLQVELDWYREEMTHLLLAAREDAKGPPASNAEGGEA